jgi:hypothetical protein
MSEITLDRLFRAKQDVVLPDGRTVQVRALSDAERKQRSTASLRASIRSDELLSKEDSDEYAIYIKPLEQASREELENIIVDWQTADIVRAAYEEFKYEFIPFPDDASDEEQKDVLLKRAESEKAVDDKRQDYIVKQTLAFREKVQSWTDVSKEAKARKRFLVSVNARYEADVYMSVYLGSEVNGKRLFQSAEEVSSLQSDVLRKLLEAQREVDSLDVWELTKIRTGRQPERVVAAPQESEPVQVA